MKNALHMRPFASSSSLMDRARSLEERLVTLDAVKSEQRNAQVALDRLQETLSSGTQDGLVETQRRLESLISNLQIQVQNMQAADALLDDVDAAVHMSDFVRHQVLTQSAVASISHNATEAMASRMAWQLL